MRDAGSNEGVVRNVRAMENVDPEAHGAGLKREGIRWNMGEATIIVHSVAFSGKIGEEKKKG